MVDGRVVLVVGVVRLDGRVDGPLLHAAGVGLAGVGDTAHCEDRDSGEDAKDDDDEKSLNAMDLAGFNYDNMDNLKIESDNETVKVVTINDDVSV